MNLGALIRKMIETWPKIVSDSLRNAFSISRTYGPAGLDSSELKLTSKVNLDALFQKMIEIWYQIVSTKLESAVFNFWDFWLRNLKLHFRACYRGSGTERAENDV